VEGSVLRSGNKVRVTAQLIDASTDTHVWAESCERDLQDILSLQGEVARTIAGAVNVAVTPQERERLSGARRVNPEAYEACLKGNSYWMKLTPQDTEAARPYFERAIEIDPECVQAYRGLAWYWIVRMQMGRSAPGEAGPKAKAAALRAIALDEACAEAHEALAAVRTGVDWDWPGAEREWLRALEINPGAANAHAYYADFLASLGRVDEALPHIERAIELDPANALFQGIYAGVLVYARRYDDALAAADKAMALQPNIAPAATARRWVYGIKGMREEQLAQQRKQISYDPERLAAFDKGLAEGGYKGARLAIAELWIKRVEKGSAGPGKGILPAFQVCSIADRYFDAGDDKQAMDWLEKAYDARDPNLRYEIRCPVWDPLHSNPRFQALARKMNIPLEAAK
jgi:tetratricopeptide (TPR) repeat protein